MLKDSWWSSRVHWADPSDSTSFRPAQLNPACWTSLTNRKMTAAPRPIPSQRVRAAEIHRVRRANHRFLTRSLVVALCLVASTLPAAARAGATSPLYKKVVAHVSPPGPPPPPAPLSQRQPAVRLGHTRVVKL